MSEPSPASGGRGGRGGGDGRGNRGVAASSQGRFDDTELRMFQARADLLDKKLESVAGTMVETHLQIDERLRKVAI